MGPAWHGCFFPRWLSAESSWNQVVLRWPGTRHLNLAQVQAVFGVVLMMRNDTSHVSVRTPRVTTLSVARYVSGTARAVEKNKPVLPSPCRADMAHPKHGSRMCKWKRGYQ